MKDFTVDMTKRPFEKGLFLFFFLINTLCSFGLIVLLQRMIDNVINRGYESFYKDAMSFILVLLSALVFTFLDQYMFRILCEKGYLDVSNNAYGRIIKYEKLGIGKDGRRITTITSDCSILANWLATGKINCIIQVFNIFICIVWMLWYSTFVSICVLIFMTVFFILAKMFSKLAAVYTAMRQDIRRNASAVICESFEYVSTVRASKGENYFINKLAKILHNNTIYKKESRYAALEDSTMSLLASTLPMIVLVLGFWLSQQDLMTIGTAFALMLISQRMNEPIIVIAELIMDREAAIAVYSANESFKGSGNEAGTKENLNEEIKTIKISIDGFRYGKKTIIGQLYETIRKGENILIKGENGTGKSTLLKLLSNMLDAGEINGTIALNSGQIINNVDRTDLHKQILLVEQETILLNDTLENNICLGEHFEEEFVNEVVKTCCLDKVKNHITDNSAACLSAGEKQRIAIARMLIRKPKYLLMDEVTSHIDKATANVLLERLKLFSDKYGITWIAVCHGNEFDKYCKRTIELNAINETPAAVVY